MKDEHGNAVNGRPGVQLTRRSGLACLIGLTALIVLVVFRDFLCGAKTYLFKDIASDSVNYSYPWFVHVADYFRSEGFPRWSFNQGMGQNIFPGCLGDPLTTAMMLLGRSAVAVGMAWCEVIKIFLAAVFFYLFLKKRKTSCFPAVAGSLMYAFSGFMVVGGEWQIFSTQAVYAALLLYAFELFYLENRPALLPFCIVLCVVNQAFNLYVFAVLLGVYILVRFFEEQPLREWRRCAVVFAKTAGLGALGAGIGAFFLVGDVMQMVNSPRGLGEASYARALFDQPVFGFGDKAHNVSALLRLFSSDMLGTGSESNVWQNYLEAPVFYCGLLALLLVPLFFLLPSKPKGAPIVSGSPALLLSRKAKAAYATLLLLVFVPVVFPFFRYAFWLFSGNYYRAYSLFVIIALLLPLVKVLEYLEQGGRLPKAGLVTVFCVLMVLLFFPYTQESVVDSRVRGTAVLFLAGYLALFLTGALGPQRAFGRLLLVVWLSVELGSMANRTLSARPVVTGNELKQKVGYNDYSCDAVAWLKARDKSFFRIEKDYASGPATHISMNDSKVQCYFGTQSYHSFNQLCYVRFLQKMGLINGDDETETRWLRGLMGVPGLHSFASIKYVLSKSSDLDAVCEKIGRVGDVGIYRNANVLPFGFTYGRLLDEAAFTNLPPVQKMAVLYKACVVRPEDLARCQMEQLHPSELTAYDFDSYVRDVAERSKEALTITSHSQNRIEGTVSLSSKKLLFFTLPFDKGWRVSVDGKRVTPLMVNIGFTGFPVEKGEHAIELQYVPPYYVESACCSALFLGLYVGLLYLNRRKSHV